MKAFIVGTAAVIVIAIVTVVILNTMGSTTAEMFASGNVRL